MDEKTALHEVDSICLLEAKERQHLRECQSISKLIEVLALLCAGDTGEITDLLTGYLWDEEEAGMIKRASNK